ncbi:hypothetical protein ACFWCF_01410 [Rhodococcus sp. NPDC060090]|uniref:hypothetical protein n=1 Tax=Rhodococcus sp. NPDC060090 TaxID=3347056 RepID=UPI0006D13EBB
MKPNRRGADPAARLCGHLLVLAGGHDRAALADAVASSVHGNSLTERHHYGAVLEWTVTAIADVIVDKLGPIDSGAETDKVLTLRTPEGENLTIEQLPPPERHVWRAIADNLAGDALRGHRRLRPVVHVSDAEKRTHALIEAVDWLDHLLDMPVRDEPDTLTE